jgi:photosystem II stability/assembly factor-like uncharacterized protein
MKIKLIGILILFFTASGGLNSQWVPLNSGTSSILHNIFFIDANTGIAVGLSGAARKTTNAGVNWTALPAGVEHLYGIWLNNASTGYICGDYQILKTINGGSTWSALTAPVELYRSIYFVNDNTGYCCAGGGIILKTSNAGINWISLTSGTTVFLNNIRFAGSSTGYAAGHNGVMLKTTNEGANWQILNTGVTNLLFGLAVINENLIYAAGENGRMIKSTDGGTSWMVQNSNAFDRIVNLYFVNSSTGTGTGFSNIIIRTTNGGTNWIPQLSGLTGQDFNGVHFTSVQTGYIAGSNGNILKTTTGGFPIPAAPNLIAPPNNSTNISITPLLDWDTVASGKTYQVQIDTDTLYASPVFDSSQIEISSVTVPVGTLINNTAYFWRVRCENAGGIGPWSANFLFTTIVALPNAPGLILPVNGASNVSLTPFFDWDSTSPAISYTLQASVDSSFTDPPVFINGIIHSFLNLTNPQLQYNYRYYWRVNAVNAAGTGPWSAVFNFTTVFGIPSAPVHLSPLNNAIDVSLTPLLDWVDDISATSYKLQLSIDSTFTNPPILDTTGFAVSQVSVPAGLLVNVTSYFWRVQTTNSIGTGPFSTPWKFTTILAPPGAPQLVDPPNNSFNISTTPVLDWDSVQYATTFRIQLSTEPGFGTTLINIGGLTFSQYNVPGGILLNNVTYYWRVNASNSAGTGPYSAVWNFRTVISPPVAAPVLISPANGAVNQSLTPTLDWNDVFGTDGYKVNVSHDSLFNTVPIDTTLGTTSQFTIPAGSLGGSTSYYWRVRGFNTGGFGPWSVTWKFSTMVIGINIISEEIPAEFNLYNNFPNPFNPVTTIKFDIPQTDNQPLSARLIIYDVTGREVAEIFSGEVRPGKYEASWNAQGMASGLYFYRLTAGEHTAIKKMVLVK